MVDYTKIYFKNIDINRLINSPLLDFKCEYSTSTAELNEDKLTAKLHFCEIAIYKINSHVIFTGSIHKFWNDFKGIKAPNYTNGNVDKGFNGNQFSIGDIVEVRQYLQELFNCEPDEMVFQNIELGVNSTPAFEPKLFLKGLLYHKSSPFDYSKQGNYAQSIHQRYIFKIYNKSLQYGMAENVLRVELKYKKMEDLQIMGIKTFADITESKLDDIRNHLLDKFNEVMYFDYTIRKAELSSAKKKSLENYSNPRYWIEDLKSIHRDRHKKSLRELIHRHSDNLQRQIADSIIEKCVIINRHSSTAKCVIINHSIIELNITQNTTPNRSKKILKSHPEKSSVCRITGLDISMQRDDSILLSHRGLKYYLEHEPRTFENLKSRFLSKLWMTSSLQNQIKEIAHNIRNTRSNQNIRQVKWYNGPQVNMLAPLGIK